MFAELDCIVVDVHTDNRVCDILYHNQLCTHLNAFDLHVGPLPIRKKKQYVYVVTVNFVLQLCTQFAYLQL